MDQFSLVDSDKNNNISALAYIFQLEPNFLLPDELNDVLLCAYQSLKGANLLDPLENIVTLLNAIRTNGYVFIDESFTIHLRDRWFCTLVILASLKHYRHFANNSNINNPIAKRVIFQQALATFRPDRYESIHLLRLIAYLVNFLDHDIESTVVIDLIVFARTVALSPLRGFRQCIENIPKMAMSYATAQQQTEFLDVDFLPLKGIPTIDLACHLALSSINDPLFQRVVTRIIEMFSNNIENREGSFLYKKLLSIVKDDFDLWIHVVWPQFYNKFLAIDCEGEFFQSLVKYWIPTTVELYLIQLYLFVCDTTISDLLKGYILLETRKRCVLNTYMVEDHLKVLFSQEKTRKIAFQIVGCHFTKKMVPTSAELCFVAQFLYEQAQALSHEEIQALQKFLTQINIAIVSARTEEEYLKCLKRYLTTMFRYSVSLLKTSRSYLGAQILLTLCNGTIKNNMPSNILTQLDLKEEPKDEFLQMLNHLESENFVKLVEQRLLESNGSCQELAELATKIVNVPRIFTNGFLMTFIDEASDALAIKASESVRNVARFVSSVRAKGKRYENLRMLHKETYEALMILFKNDWSESMDSKVIFKAALLFEVLNQVLNYYMADKVLKGVYAVWFPAVATMLQQKCYQLEQDPSMTSEQWLSAKNKKEKIVEALYNNVCHYLLNDKTDWSSVDQPKLMDALVRVIEYSSMRKPTMMSADLLKYAAALIDEEVRGKRKPYQDVPELQTLIDEEKKKQSLANFKVKLLDQTLQKLGQAASVQNLTIRRNPETRLVLHALCLSDSSPQKYLLTWTLKHLLEVLSNETCTDATTAAALHCTEIMMSDNTLHSHTLKYAPGVILECVRHFKNRNWVVRNACVQLAKALIDRFLGVLIGRNTRSKSVEDLFALFPQIALPFCQILTDNPLTDSALAVMQFFLESQLKRQPYTTEFSAVTREAFLQAFVTLIKENSDLYGLFAAKAYVSLCLDDHIPGIVQHIVDFIMENFNYIRSKHTLRNFMHLLEELFDKYVDSKLDKPFRPKGFYRIHQSLNEMTMFFSRFNSRQFDCLLVKVVSVRCSLSVLQNIDIDTNDYQQKMWLHNYVPFLVINTRINDLSHALLTILNKEIPEYLQVKVLSILVDRLTKEQFCDDILMILIRKALDVENASNYLLMCYFKVILRLFEEFQDVQIICYDVLDMLRRSYEGAVNNTYKLFITLLILAKIEKKSEPDKRFFKSSMQHFQNMRLTDEDLTENVSEMLKYLYANSLCLCDRRRILKIAVLLIVEHGLWHFATFIIKSNIPSPIQAIQKLLDFHFLRIFFGSDVLAYEFVKEFYTVAVLNSDNTDIRSINVTYYVEEECVFVDKDCIGRIVIKFLRDYCTSNKMDWLECYSAVRTKNKILI